MGAYFNFLLWDEARLEGWQSGLYWTDRTPKPSVPAFEEAVCRVHTGCGSIHTFAEPNDSHTREMAVAAVAAAVLGGGAILLVLRRSRRRRISR